ncbi:MAG: hypothetical protein ACP5NC_08410 [Nitrososphaeria archaeon]
MLDIKWEDIELASIIERERVESTARLNRMIDRRAAASGYA